MEGIKNKVYIKLHEIVIITLIIGIYNIYKIIGNVNILLFESIKINDKMLLNFLLILIFFSLIFFNSKSLNLEIELILALGLIAIFVLISTKELLLLFLSLELYSLSVYLLLFQNDQNKANITLLYFLLGSISSSFILLGIAILYIYTGSLDFTFIFYNFDIISLFHSSFFPFFALALFFLGFLFKIGAAPFNWWVIRIYSQMELRIIAYQSIVPKIFYFYLIISFLSDFNPEFLEKDNIIIKILILASILSLLVGSIGPLTHNISHLKTIFAYSSILHIGYILLGILGNILSGNNILMTNIIQYLVIYGINTLQIFLAFIIFFETSYLNYLNKPLFLFSLLISIFSFIGIPPLAGFYAKLNIFFNCFFAMNSFFLFSIFLILFSTIVSAFFYLKFINYFYFKNLSNFENLVTDSKLISGKIYILSFLTLILIIYPFLLPYFNPFFDFMSLL